MNNPTIAGGFLNNAIMKDRIPKQVFEGMEICRTNGINLVANSEITMPNCTNTSWTVDSITARDIRLALTPGTSVFTHYTPARQRYYLSLT